MTPETTEARTRERWKQALDLFEQALPLPPTEREQILAAAAHQDQALRQTVSDLLLAHRDAEAGAFLESPSWVYQPIEANPQALVGRRIGPYLLTQYLAKGGMGIVYLAERADKVFRRQAAVKLIGADTGASHYHRFKREVQILADLKHPNLVMLYDAGRLADGRLYLVMEYVEGETLREWVNRRGPMPPATAVEVIQHAAAGLHAAHEAGIIHRDIKPANIVAAETGGKLTVKVLDFGVAARKHHDGSGVSSTQGAIGTLLYMSPEQLQSTKGRDLTPASDVYALGLTAYELLTGRPAIDGQSQAEIITKHLYEMPPTPSQKRPDLKLSPGIDRVVMKALSKAPSDRHQSALEFAADLEMALSQPLNKELPKPVVIENLDRSTEELPRPQPLPQSATGPTPARTQVKTEKRNYAKPGAVIAGAAIVTAASIYWWPNGNEQPQAQQVAAASPSLVTTLQPQAPKLLKLFLTVDNTSSQPLPDSSFALFKAGITKVPATVTKENALIFVTDQNGRAESKTADIPAGTYVWKAARNGYQAQSGEVTLQEDPSRPGTSSLALTLGPK